MSAGEDRDSPARKYADRWRKDRSTELLERISILEECSSILTWNNDPTIEYSRLKRAVNNINKVIDNLRKELPKWVTEDLITKTTQQEHRHTSENP